MHQLNPIYLSVFPFDIVTIKIDKKYILLVVNQKIFKCIDLEIAH